ncbi:hypothetical protein Tco_0275175, partial [Tanacetum coccineum]
VDADSEARGDTREADSKGKDARDSEKGRNKSYLVTWHFFKLEIEDSDVEEIYGSAKGSSKDKVGIYSDKNKQKRYMIDDSDL